MALWDLSSCMYESIRFVEEKDDSCIIMSKNYQQCHIYTVHLVYHFMLIKSKFCIVQVKQWVLKVAAVLNTELLLAS